MSRFEISENDLYWLAGLLEGEGYFGCNKNSQCNYHYAKITVAMKDRDVIERVQKVIGSGSISVDRYKREPHHSTIHRYNVVADVAESVMIQILPIMGERRAQKIDEVLSKLAKVTNH